MTRVDVTIPDVVGAVARDSETRLELWTTFLDRITARKDAEIGVDRGAFAAHLLASCPAIERYSMITSGGISTTGTSPPTDEDGTFQRSSRKP